MLDYLSVGYVLKPQGLTGEIKVEPLTDDIKRYNSLDRLFIKDAEEYSELNIISRRYTKGFVFLKIKGYDSIEKAETLRNKYLWIPRNMVRVLPKNTYYIADLIGCNVETLSGWNLGSVVNVMQTGSNDVYVINGDKGEILIPALKKVIKEIKIDKGTIIVDHEELKGLLPDED